MRKQSRIEIENELEAVKRERDVLAVILSAIENREKPIVEKARGDGGGEYVFKLYRPTSPYGGVVSCSYFWLDQRPLVTVDYLDKMNYPTGQEWLPLNIALEHLRLARQRLLEQGSGCPSHLMVAERGIAGNLTGGATCPNCRA
jgi:hypothetical protein